MKKKDIWAVDFDDFICRSDILGTTPTLDNPPNQSTVSFINSAYDAGVKIIVHTSRPAKDKQLLEKYLRYYEVKFHSIETGKLHAHRYFGDNYFNQIKYSSLYKRVSDESVIELLRVVRNYKEEMFHILDRVQENESLAFLARHVIDMNNQGKYPTIFLTGVGNLIAIAKQFANELHFELKKNGFQFVNTVVLGSNSGYTNEVALTNRYDDIYRLEFISRIKFLPTSSKPVLIIFSEKGTETVTKNLALEASMVFGCETFIFSGAYPTREMYSGIKGINNIVLHTKDLSMLRSVYPAISSILLTLYKRYMNTNKLY